MEAVTQQLLQPVIQFLIIGRLSLIHISPGDCARALYRAGVRVFSLSNNHTYDKGASGIAATLRFWDSMPEDVVTIGLWKGESDYGHIPLQTVNGVTIAYLSYTEHTNGIPQNSSMQDVYKRQVLAEQCFVTNEADVAQFGSEEGCKKTARVYYEAICAYFGTQPQAEQLAGFTLN